MVFWENPDISTELDEESNEKVNLVWLIAEAKKDWKIDINELIKIENEIQDKQIEVKEITEKNLNEYRNKILENWISINSWNKDRILKYLEKEWFKIPENIQNMKDDFSITIDDNNNIVEEWFFSTEYNNDSAEISENDLSSEFHSDEITEFLDWEWKQIINDWLNYLWEELSSKSVPNSYISDVKSFVENNYDIMTNEEKILLINAFKDIQEWNYNKVLKLFEKKLTSWEIVNHVMILWLLTMATAMILLLWATMPVWLLLASWTAVAGTTVYTVAKEYDTISKQGTMHFKNKTNRYWYLEEDKLF